MNNVDMLSGIPNIIIVESSVVAFLNTSENQYVRLQIQKGLEFLSSDANRTQASTRRSRAGLVRPSES